MTFIQWKPLGFNLSPRTTWPTFFCRVPYLLITAIACFCLRLLLCVMPDRPVGLQFVAGQQLFWISQCEVLIAYLCVYRLGENTVSHSVSALGVPVTQYSGLAAITAWHCVSSVNTDDSRPAELYYNSTKLQYRYYFKTSNGYKAHDLSLAW